MVAEFFSRPLIELVAFMLFTTGTVVLLVILLAYYVKLAVRKEKGLSTDNVPLTVMIFVHNEQYKIESIVRDLLVQAPPQLEIVIIDMYSEDDTATVLTTMSRRFPQLKISFLREEIRFYDKIAINLAVKAASNERLVIVPPTAENVSPDYARMVASVTSEEPVPAIGYNNLAPGRGFLRLLCRTERFFNFLTTAVWSAARIPMFFQATNVMFNRSLYLNADGFRGKMNRAFANVELLFNETGRHKTEVILSPQANLLEDDTLQLSDFAELVQRRIMLRRSLATYKRLLLSAEDAAKCLLTAGFILMLLFDRNYWLFYTPYLPVFILHLFIIRKILNKLHEKALFFPVILYMFIRPLASIYHRLLLFFHLQRKRWI
ncbi:MAG: glycosyltransferase [Bacteroidales bacterium]|jgi:glycosyltransferase involved in cell wall biosynthesis|nr:glycosyltransferase [Bacteroidales bacterium]